MAEKPLFKIKQHHANKLTDRYVNQMQDRFDSVRRMVPSIAANSVLDSVKSTIPRGDDFKTLKKSLKVAEVTNTGDDNSFAIHADVKAAKVKKIDVARTVLYVRALRRMEKVSPGVKILEDYGPWTPDTIPFWPKKSEAVVVQRKVQKRVADRIVKQQNNQKDKIRALLDKAGPRQPSKAKQKETKPPRTGKAIPDVMFTATSLEFGGNGKKPVPAWRKSIKNFRAEQSRTVFKDNKELKAAIYNSRDIGWRHYPKKGKTIKSKEVKTFRPFMKRLGF